MLTRHAPKMLLVAIVLAMLSAVTWAVAAETYVYDGAWGTQGTANGQFNEATCIAIDGALGRVYVTDFHNNRVQYFSLTGTYLGQFPSTYPWGIGVAASTHDVYVADSGYQNVHQYHSNGTLVRSFGSGGTGPGQFNHPWGLAVDSSHDAVYVIDGLMDHLDKFKLDGTSPTTVGTGGTGDGQFADPNDVAVDQSGNVYVIDSGNQRVQVLSPSGTFLRKWGTKGSGDGQFTWPDGIGVDSVGNVYVADGANDRVQKFSSTGTFLAKLGSGGTGDGQFNVAWATAVYGSEVYVTDFWNYRIQRWRPFSTAPAPTVVSATCVDPTHVNVLFSKALNAATVGAVGNYSVSPSLTVSAAALDADTKTVHLSTAAQVALTTYTVTVSGVKDTLGNAVAAGSGDCAAWTASVAAPTVIAALPTSTHQSAEKPTITTAFSTAMNKTSAEGALSITPAQAAGVPHGWPGAFTWMGNQMQYKLGATLAPSTIYTVTITTAAKSSGGASLASNKVWSFTTSSAPAIASHSPTGTAVPLSTTGKIIRIGFNQAMNKASVQSALWVYKTGTTPPATPTRPAGSFSWSGNEMRYAFTSKLAALTSYTVKLGKTAKSSGGVSRTAVFVWSFKTGGAATAPNTVTVASAPTAYGAQITLNLASAAKVTVSIRNLAGREVAVLQPGELAAGVQSLLWTGKSTLGTKVPAGTYLLEVTARAEDGSQSRALTTLHTRD